MRLHRVYETKGEGDVATHLRFHPLTSHHRLYIIHRWRCSVYGRVSGSKWDMNSPKGIWIHSELRKDEIVNEGFKVSYKPLITKTKKAEVKCRHRLPAVTTASPPTRLCWSGRYVGSQHQFSTVTQPNGTEHWRPPLKWIRSITVCRGEEPRGTV